VVGATPRFPVHFTPTGASWINLVEHTTPDVQAWLTAHPDVRFHFTPKGASWLNLVEAWFSILTRKSVRRASF